MNKLILTTAFFLTISNSTSIAGEGEGSGMKPINTIDPIDYNENCHIKTPKENNNPILKLNFWISNLIQINRDNEGEILNQKNNSCKDKIITN